MNRADTGENGTAPPFVSVVMLTRNRAGRLKEALASLAGQRHPGDRMEIVVADDGSTDPTPALLRDLAARDPRMRAVRPGRRGIPAARNAGIRAARGDFIAIVADDYLLAPDYLAHIVSFFNDHPDAQVVRFRIVPARMNLSSRLSHFAYELAFRKRLDPDPGPPPPGWRARLRFFLRPPPLPPWTVTAEHDLEAAGGAAYRRAVFDAVGLFDEDLLRAEDTDMGRRLRKAGVAVWFDPFHTIAHQYGTWRDEVLVKAFRSGVYHARLAARGTAKPDDSPDGRGTSGLLILRRAVQLAGGWRALWFLPAVAAGELARRAGVAWGRRRRPRAA